MVAAIESGIFNDLGSGSNVDVCVSREKETKMLRNYRKPNERAQKEQSYKFARGTTAFTKEEIYNMIVKEGTHLRPLTLDVLGLDNTTPDATATTEAMDTDAS